MPIDEVLEKLIGDGIPEHMNEFYDQVKDIVVFPGSVSELNDMMKSEGKQYKLMPVKGPKKYLTGALLPTKDEMKSLIAEKLGALDAFQQSNAANELFDGELPDLGDISVARKLITSIFSELLNNPTYVNMDIRVKAKQMGADGLVRVQPDTSKDTYLGVPVKAV